MKFEIDTDILIGIGEEYLYAANEFWKARHNSGYRRSDVVWMESHRNRNDALWRAYAEMEKCRKILYAAAELLNMDSAHIINAARCYDRYYAHGGTQLLDTGKLIVGMR